MTNARFSPSVDPCSANSSPFQDRKSSSPVPKLTPAKPMMSGQNVCFPFYEAPTGVDNLTNS